VERRRDATCCATASDFALEHILVKEYVAGSIKSPLHTSLPSGEADNIRHTTVQSQICSTHRGHHFQPWSRQHDRSRVTLNPDNRDQVTVAPLNAYGTEPKEGDA
jgi:hypothetical protein